MNLFINITRKKKNYNFETLCPDGPPTDFCLKTHKVTTQNP